MWGSNGFWRARLKAAMFLVAVLCGLDACQSAFEPPPRQTGGDSSTLLLADLALGPVSTYVHACERCHGPEGAFFSEVFQRQTREELHEINLEMMVGPGQLDPTEAEVDAMTDYMLAVRQKQPYLVLINGQTFSNGQTDSLKGEMRPGTTLSVEDAPSALNTHGNTWSLESPTLPLTLKATWKGHEREFAVPAP